MRAGAPTVPDMARWEEYVHIPDLDEMDWEHSAEANRAWFAARDFVELCKDRRLVLNGATDPRLLALVYEESRKYYAQFDD